MYLQGKYTSAKKYFIEVENLNNGYLNITMGLIGHGSYTTRIESKKMEKAIDRIKIDFIDNSSLEIDNYKTHNFIKGDNTQCFRETFRAKFNYNEETEIMEQITKINVIN